MRGRLLTARGQVEREEAGAPPQRALARTSRPYIVAITGDFTETAEDTQFADADAFIQGCARSSGRPAASAGRPAVSLTCPA